MMCKISILVITTVICFTWVEANPSYKYDKNGCGPKEHFIENYEFCEPTCTDAHPLICTRFGGSSCYCVSGYARNDNEDCVKIEECPNPYRAVDAKPSDKYDKDGCGPKEHLVDNNPSCEPTCSNPHPFICTRLGGPSCYCVSGYLRNSNGDCIKKEKCPKRRGGDIIFLEN